MSDHVNSLNDAYKGLSSGFSPVKSSYELASTLFFCITQPLSVDDSDQCQNNEVTCIALTLVEKISSKVTSSSMSSKDSLYFKEVTRILFQDMDLMSTLVLHLQFKDQLISHLAAKSISVYSFLELKECGTVNQLWEQKCMQVFHNPYPHKDLEACIWSITAVLKMLLKESVEYKSKMLEKLLIVFDPALCALCSKLLPADRPDEEQCAVHYTHPAAWGNILSTLLDLLEVLTGINRFKPGSRVRAKSQRLVYTHASALLKTVNSPLKYIVKKRVLLLLKRTLLQKTGEDMTLGGVPASAPRVEPYLKDLFSLADEVLHAVKPEWLQRVPVAAASSCFGGLSQSCDGTVDHLMLRAVNLVVLKSLHYKILSAGDEAKMDLHGYLETLLLFLGQRGVPLKRESHLCTWVSLVFGDQDDDMIEAAKILLFVHNYHRLPARPDDDDGFSAAECASGCNPHCHFLVFLQGISFDHSTLLDFLISTETCFLEYFVRYLKHLQGDRKGFSLACRKMCALDCCHINQSSCIPSLCGSELSRNQRLLPSGTATVCGQSIIRTPGTTPLRLVDYGSSEDSDTEDMEVASGLLDSSDVARSRGQPAPSFVDIESGKGSTDSTYGSVPDLAKDGREPLRPFPQVTKDPFQDTSNNVIYIRSFSCLSELRKIVERLQRKNLFPYNPTSLLKLLAHVEI